MNAKLILVFMAFILTQYTVLTHKRKGIFSEIVKKIKTTTTTKNIHQTTTNLFVKKINNQTQMIIKKFDPLIYLKKNGYDLGMIQRENILRKASIKSISAPLLEQDQNDQMSRMIILFQQLHYLPITGKIDEVTLNKIKSPSCANPDIMNKITDIRLIKRQINNNMDPKWIKKNLTYKIINLDQTLKEYTRIAIRDAFQDWSNVTDFKFREVLNLNEKTDIEIDFVSREHGDGFPFNEFVQELAHAFFPTDGRIHFSNSIQFTRDSTEGYNLRIIAAHEIGHTLGLEHNNEIGSLMNKYYPGFLPNFTLPDSDRKRIQLFYNLTHIDDKTTTNNTPFFSTTKMSTKNTAKSTTTTTTTTSSLNRPKILNYKSIPPCYSSIDAIFYSPDMKSLYATVKGELWKYDIEMHAWEKSQIKSTYQSMHSDFRAGFEYDGQTYFLRGRNIWAYNGYELAPGYPKYINDPLYPNNPYTAIKRQGNVYVLKGSLVYNLDLKELKLDPTPLYITNVFPQIPRWIEASLHHDGFYYFFIDKWVYKFDEANNQLVNDYPKIKHLGWFACEKVKFKF